MKRSNEMILLGVGLSILFWILETTIHTYIFHEGPFLRELFPSHYPNELWMRFVVCAILIIFGFHAQYVIDKRRQAEKKLKRSEEELRLLSSQLFSIQEEEKAQLAGQLHDNIGQSLVAVKYIAEKFLLEIEDDPKELNVESINNLISTIQNIIEEFRRIFMYLRPSTIDEIGILATINWYCREIKKLYPKITIERKINIKENDIPVFLRIHIYRVLQEAINNVMKHSQATKGSISLEKQKDFMKLGIEDNGIGFDLETALSVEKSKRGFGMGSMKERVRLSGGIFSINSVVGKGTEVQASWPVE